MAALSQLQPGIAQPFQARMEISSRSSSVIVALGKNDADWM